MSSINESKSGDADLALKTLNTLQNWDADKIEKMILTLKGKGGAPFNDFPGIIREASRYFGENAQIQSAINSGNTIEEKVMNLMKVKVGNGKYYIGSIGGVNSVHLYALYKQRTSIGSLNSGFDSLFTRIQNSSTSGGPEGAMLKIYMLDAIGYSLGKDLTECNKDDPCADNYTCYLTNDLGTAGKCIPNIERNLFVNANHQQFNHNNRTFIGSPEALRRLSAKVQTVSKECKAADDFDCGPGRTCFVTGINQGKEKGVCFDDSEVQTKQAQFSQHNYAPLALANGRNIYVAEKQRAAIEKLIRERQALLATASEGRGAAAAAAAAALEELGMTDKEIEERRKAELAEEKERLDRNTRAEEERRRMASAARDTTEEVRQGIDQMTISGALDTEQLRRNQEIKIKLNETIAKLQKLFDAILEQEESKNPVITNEKIADIFSKNMEITLVSGGKIPPISAMIKFVRKTLQVNESGVLVGLTMLKPSKVSIFTNESDALDKLTKVVEALSTLLGESMQASGGAVVIQPATVPQVIATPANVPTPAAKTALDEAKLALARCLQSIS